MVSKGQFVGLDWNRVYFLLTFNIIVIIVVSSLKIIACSIIREPIPLLLYFNRAIKTT